MLHFSRGRRGHYVFPDEYPPMSRDVFTVAAFRWKTHQLVSAYCDQVLGDVEHIEYLRMQGSRLIYI